MRGLYFIADDRVLDLAIAFLNSVRESNQDLKLCLVPYSENISRLQSLAVQYKFFVFDRDDVLNWCDEVSRRFHGRVLGQYRKLAMWQGEWNEFLYVDVDAVILADLMPVFDLLRYFDILASHSDLPGLIRWVWKKSICQANELLPDQIAFSANTGFICSRKDALSFERISSLLPGALRVRNHMELRCAEQPLLNYLIVKSGARYTSLLSLARCFERLRIAHGLVSEQWAGNRGLVIGKSDCRSASGRRVAVLHWAGKWQPTAIERGVFRVLRALGCKEEPQAMRAHVFMPYSAVWRRFRYASPTTF
jgi:hypothetical protein